LCDIFSNRPWIASRRYKYSPRLFSHRTTDQKPPNNATLCDISNSTERKVVTKRYPIMNAVDESEYDEFGDCDYLNMIDESVFDPSATSSACTGDLADRVLAASTTTMNTPKTLAFNDKNVSTSMRFGNNDCDLLSSSTKRQKTVLSLEATSPDTTNLIPQNQLENGVLHETHMNDEDTSDGIQELRTRLLQTLQEFFGYTQFRTQQLEVMIQLIYYRRDSTIFWATGQGKSLCYQIPALLQARSVAPSNFDPSQVRSSVVIVISPLISLMQDQVYKLNSLVKSDSSHGSKSPFLATYLGSTNNGPDAEDQFDAILHGRYKLIYMTPEKLLNGSTIPFLTKLHTSNHPIALFAVDEAHCVSEWGFDFRRYVVCFVTLGKISICYPHFSGFFL
jgi:DEAD/DEAH box helicase